MLDRTNDFTSIRKAGYRDAVQETDAKELQAGFDEGFVQGSKAGKLLGAFYADCVVEVQGVNSVKDHSKREFILNLKSILYDDYDVTGSKTDVITMLKNLVEKYDMHELKSLIDGLENELTELF